MILENLPFAEYLAIEAASNSGLKRVRRSPAHFKYPEPQKKDSRAMEIGRAIHCAILEPELFQSTYHVAEADDRVSAFYKGMANDFGGDLVLTRPEYRRVSGMMESAYRNKRFAELMRRTGRNELSLVTDDPATGVKIKVRFDRKGDGLFALDLKKCQDARGSEFCKAIGNYGYYMQIPFYAWAWELETGEKMNCSRDFPIVALEEDSPHAVVLHDLDEIALELGRRHFRQALDDYARCMDAGEWQAYPEESEITSIPAWMANELLDDVEFGGV